MTTCTQRFIEAQTAIEHLTEALFDDMAATCPEVDIHARRLIQAEAARLRLVWLPMEHAARLWLEPIDMPGAPVELAHINCDPAYDRDDAEQLALRWWFISPIRDAMATRN